MSSRFTSTRLLDTASALALSASALLGAAAFQPAEAAQGIYGGGSTLLSLSARQLFDCYHGGLLNSSEPYTFSSSFPTTFTAAAAPGYLPTTCTSASYSVTTVEGLYAGVGSGSGQRGFIANDAYQLLQTPTSTAGVNYFPLPASTPLYIDGTGNSPYGTYPYPELDFGAGDSPISLPSAASTLTGTSTTLVANYLTTVSFSHAGFSPSGNWQTLPVGATNSITAPTSSTIVVTYSTATYGQPIQIPAAEVPVAIVLNLNLPSTVPAFTDNSGTPTSTTAGGAIQLSAAQICAIFSGEVNDWGSTAPIAYLPAGTTVATTTSTTATNYFYADNTSSATRTAVPYVATIAPTSTGPALPITIVYRSDGSGTSYITTNYLHAVCPKLDNGSNNYNAIFGASNLPSTSFSNLISNIKSVTGVDVTAATYNTDYTGTGHPWIGASGSANVAARIGNAATDPLDGSQAGGRIGYVSNDFTAAYSTSSTAPVSASLQDEALRANGVNHPGDTGSFTTAQNFIAPTPANGQHDWQNWVNPPSNATATFNEWNVYNITLPTTLSSGGLNLGGLNALAWNTTLNAYPLTGTTYFYLYSCYNPTTTTRVGAIQQFVAWLTAGGDSSLPHGTPASNSNANPEWDADLPGILQNNGFHQLPPPWADALIAEYVLPGIDGGTGTTAIASASSATDGCTGVTGGAN